MEQKKSRYKGDERVNGRRYVRYGAMVGTLLVAITGGVLMYRPWAYADAVQNPSNAWGLGWIDAATKGIKGSDKFRLSYLPGTISKGLPPEGYYYGDMEPVTVYAISGTTQVPNIDGWITSYAEVNKDADNGWHLVAWNDVSDWIMDLNGNASYVSSYLQDRRMTLTDTRTGKSTTVTDLSMLVPESGVVWGSMTSTVSGEKLIDHYELHDSGYPTAIQVTGY